MEQIEQIALFLWERFLLFWPSIAILLAIGGALRAYFKFLNKRYGEHLKDMEWVKENGGKITLLYVLPTLWFVSPVIEELMFRMPLIFFFGSITPLAWIGIGVSSVVFALMHWFSGFSKAYHRGLHSGLHSKKDAGVIAVGVETPDPKQEKSILYSRVWQVFATSILGILAGYYGVYYQSIWVSIGIHLAWNVAAITVFPIFVGLVVVAILCVLAVWEKFMSFVRRRRCRTQMRFFVLQRRSG
ncbi:MAG: CPBP family intramembrane metalloprotease [Candidatus Niyogibacteria bacterium]|nr:CPBP family intramembrane metalloprotease [Candidatus Niyogibacteria bacterium]